MRADISREIIQSAVSGEGGEQTVALDLSALEFVRDRLSVGDFGRLSVQIARASAAKRPSELQRLLLAIVLRHDGGQP